MRGRLCFDDLKSALSHTLICPCPLEAETLLARVLPSGTGPSAELCGSVLVVDGVTWRFKRPCEAQRVAELMECYFRKFDPEYSIADTEPPEAARSSISVR